MNEFKNNLAPVCDAFWNIYNNVKASFAGGAKGIIKDSSVVSSWKVLFDFFGINDDDVAYANVFGKYASFAQGWIRHHKIQHLNGYKYRFVKVDENIFANLYCGTKEA